MYHGAPLMLFSAPIVNSCNRISVVECHNGCSSRRAIQQIYQGTVDLKKNPSLWHFQRGLGAHLAKEIPRLTFKPIGLMWLKPELDDHYRKQGRAGDIKASLIFSGALSACEIAINPVDTCRTVWQSGQKVKNLVGVGQSLGTRLYAGSLGNGVRQFSIWMGYSAADRLCNEKLEQHGYDIYSLKGISIKALPESFLFTLPAWLPERIKNELQYRPHLIEKAKANHRSRYSMSVEYIYRTQGIQGFCRGFLPKVCGNGVLVAGANILVALRQKQGL